MKTMNRIAGVVLVVFLGCGGGPSASDAGEDAGVDAGERHSLDCTLHTTCDLSDGGVLVFVSDGGSGGCDSAESWCSVLSSVPVYKSVYGIPDNAVCHDCSLTDCVETQLFCQ